MVVKERPLIVKLEVAIDLANEKQLNYISFEMKTALSKVVDLVVEIIYEKQMKKEDRKAVTNEHGVMQNIATNARRKRLQNASRSNTWQYRETEKWKIIYLP